MIPIKCVLDFFLALKLSYGIERLKNAFLLELPPNCFLAVCFSLMLVHISLRLYHFSYGSLLAL